MIAEIRTHKGQKFVYTDYRGAKNPGDLLSLLEKGDQLLNENSNITKLLSNFSGTHLSKEFSEKVKVVGQGKKIRTALVGVTGIQSILINAINIVVKFDTKVFENEEQAMDWLIL